MEILSRIVLGLNDVINAARADGVAGSSEPSEAVGIAQQRVLGLIVILSFETYRQALGSVKSTYDKTMAGVSKSFEDNNRNHHNETMRLKTIIRDLVKGRISYDNTAVVDIMREEKAEVMQ